MQQLRNLNNKYKQVALLLQRGHAMLRVCQYLDFKIRRAQPSIIHYLCFRFTTADK